LKGAQADLAEAKTRQLGSAADLDDLDFTRKSDGTEHNEEMQKKAFDHGATIAHEKEKQKGKPLTK
jgi:hypothetical protein